MVTERLFPVPQTVTTSDDYYTEPRIFERLGLAFDLDVCAPPGGVPWVPAASFYTQEDDALVKPWKGMVWMNPPFSNPAPFVDKFIAHADGVALVPSSNGRWLTRLWETDMKWVILEPVTFHRQIDAPIPQKIWMRCWLVAAGETAVRALAAFGKVR
jgi:hypothetical protein